MVGTNTSFSSRRDQGVARAGTAQPPGGGSGAAYLNSHPSGIHYNKKGLAGSAKLVACRRLWKIFFLGIPCAHGGAADTYTEMICWANSEP